MHLLWAIASITNIGNENITIAIVGYFIVFLSLIVLVSLFLSLPKLIQLQTKRTMRSKGIKVPDGTPAAPISGEENAAIALAVHLFLSEIHDDESNVITIKKVSRSYSPWSSKIYGLNGPKQRLW